MPRIARTQLAKIDAIEIWCFIAEHSEAAADGTIEQLEERLKLLVEYPSAGESVEYIRPDVRRSIVGNYVIYYVPDEDGIIVVRILHTARRHDDLV